VIAWISLVSSVSMAHHHKLLGRRNFCGWSGARLVTSWHREKEPTPALLTSLSSVTRPASSGRTAFHCTTQQVISFYPKVQWKPESTEQATETSPLALNYLVPCLWLEPVNPLCCTDNRLIPMFVGISLSIIFCSYSGAANPGYVGVNQVHPEERKKKLKKKLKKNLLIQQSPTMDPWLSSQDATNGGLVSFQPWISFARLSAYPPRLL
jgi:hypothetical protein